MYELKDRLQNDELYHHGIKGQKWGVIRNRRSSGGSKRHKRVMSEDAAEAKRIKKKRLSEMSNAELQKLNNRQNLERQYKSLNPSTVKKGMLAMAGVAGAIGTINNLVNKSDKLIGIGKNAGNKIVDKIGNIVINDLNKHI